MGEQLLLNSKFTKKTNFLTSHQQKLLLKSIFLSESTEYKTSFNSITRFRLPNLFIIGEEKCGTTILYNFIKEHDAVIGSDLNYDELVWSGEKYLRILNLKVKYNEIENFYKYFQTRDKTGNEDILNNLTFLVVLCDPTVRAWSDYNTGQLNTTFGDIVDDTLSKF